MIDTAVILVGGKGMRMRPLTDDIPKSMVEVHGKPIIAWIILWLKKNGITNIIPSVDYKKEVIMDYLGNGEQFGVRISYNDHTGCHETGDVFRTVLERKNLPQTFLALNGDQITDLPIADLAAHHERHKPLVTLVTCPVCVPYGIVDITTEGKVRSFVEKPILSDILMSTGIYVFDKKILEHLPRRGSIEKTTFVKLAEIDKLHSYNYTGLFKTMNDQKDIEEAELFLQENSNIFN